MLSAAGNSFIDREADSTWDIMEACFTAFDRNCDDNLNLQEFETLCRALFRNSKDESYKIDSKQLEDIFSIFDDNSDGLIDRQEFVSCWNDWIKTIVKPVSALILVDVQNDFISGTLDIRKCPAGHNGEEVIKPINKLLDTVHFDAYFYSFDWHPIDHVSFIENIHIRPLHESSPVKAQDAKIRDTVVFDGEPPMEQTLWPKHCVQNTWGAELHKDLKIIEDSIKIYKGTHPDIDSYSVFRDNMKLTDTKLVAQLKSKNVTDVYICGVAYDVCVGSTTIDAINEGYRTILLDDCCRGVDLLNIEQVKQSITSNHGVIAYSSEVKDMVAGRDRRPELGYKLAVELKNKKSKSSTA